METTIVHWGSIGVILENKMETTIVYWCSIGVVLGLHLGYIGVILGLY